MLDRIKNSRPWSFIERLFDLFSTSPLEAAVKKTIQNEGPITIERYMQIVLQDPEHGYYRIGDPIGRTRDFCTAPEATQLFGEMMGVWCVDAWQRMGKPDPFVLLELGPGRGTLMNDLLRFTEPLTGFHKALRLRLFDSNATLREIQKQKLARFKPQHLEDLAQLEPLPTLFIANELFDNMPIRQFTKTEDGWQETLVGLEGGKLALVKSASTAFMPNPLAAAHIKSPKAGNVYEISEMSQAIVSRLALHIVHWVGAGLIVDYGYTSPSGSGTLDAWHRSRPTSILAKPGKTDVTADVDFSALASAAKRQGAQTILMSQGEFLLNLGTNSRVEALKQNQSATVQKRLDESFDQLVSSEKMGELWKVMIINADRR